MRLGSDATLLPSSGYFTIGVHPYDVEELSEGCFEVLSSMATNPRCVGIGECGIDKRVGGVDNQAVGFKRHCNVAQELNKPIVIHCVRAQNEILSIVSGATIPKLFHAYHKYTKQLGELNNTYFSLTINNIAHARDIPLSKIVLESDDGDCYELYRAYEVLSAERKVGTEELRRIVAENFYSIYRVE